MLAVQRIAVEVVRRVLEGRSLTEVLERRLAREAALDPGGRGAVRDITHGTLRFLGLLRALIARLVVRPLEDRDLEALIACALYQLEFTRAAPYAVVDGAVECAAAFGRPWAKGLVNAVLRRFLRERQALIEQARAEPAGRYSYPNWWIAGVKSQHPDHWQAILDAGNGHPPLALRVNARRTTREDYLARLAREGIEASPVGASGVVIAHPQAAESLPGFAEGLVSVQDAGAQRAAPLLDARPGQRVLDACAAPGGKTAHLLEIADVALVALDNDAARVARIGTTLARLGHTATIACADASDPQSWWDGRAFDRVLLDAPCSASGVVRRHPDIKWLRRASDLERFAARQSALLDALWRVLAPDGKLLYATCSVFREENRARIDEFLGRHADARLAPLCAQGEPDLLLLPNDSHDGFYHALLERR